MKWTIMLIALMMCAYSVTASSPMQCGSCDESSCYQGDFPCKCGSYKDECECCDRCYRCLGESCNTALLQVCLKSKCLPAPGDDTPVYIKDGICQEA